MSFFEFYPSLSINLGLFIPNLFIKALSFTIFHSIVNITFGLIKEFFFEIYGIASHKLKGISDKVEFDAMVERCFSCKGRSVVDF